MTITTIQCDIAIIGTGAAGLAAAIHLARLCPDKNILIGTKTELNNSNSACAQGGIAVPWDMPFDNEENHIHDTMQAGGFKNNLLAVRTIIQDARLRIAELAEWGMPFDRNANGQLRLHREGGHAHHRVAHHGDTTGRALILTLLQKLQTLPNVSVKDHFFATDLVLDDDKHCTGFEALYKGHKVQVSANHTLLATGGIGQLYETSTNPTVATGDGIAMAHRAGAETKHMAFIQFHPTAWYHPGKKPSDLVTEAIRGEGAVLRNCHGEAFMKNRHPQADLASRDVMARSIFLEMQATGKPHVWLDISSISRHKLQQQFPKLWSNLQHYHLDPGKDWIPVVPAAHYLCGGIHTDLQGQTNIPRLYALGECAHTGFHGANRLASNSLLEGVVMAHRCVAHLTSQTVKIKTSNNSLTVKRFPTATFQSLPRGQTGKANRSNSGLTAKSIPTGELQQLMQQHANVVRDEQSLHKALEQISKLECHFHHEKPNQAAWELANMLTTARLILQDSLKREENAGVFYKERTMATTQN